jgi:hypothetical protein
MRSRKGINIARSLSVWNGRCSPAHERGVACMCGLEDLAALDLVIDRGVPIEFTGQPHKPTGARP